MEKMTRELFENGQLFTTVLDIEHRRKHTYRYFPSGRIERYYMGIQDTISTERYSLVDMIEDNGFNSWVELFNVYFDRKMLFEDLVVVEEKQEKQE